MITVFYDGQCGLCSKEIMHYRNIAADGIFDWREISSSEDALKGHGIRLTDALKMLHVVDQHQTVFIGVDAFLLIWRQLPRWHLLASFTASPLIKPLATFAYIKFANWRFKRLAHCQLAAKNEKGL